MSVSLHFLDGSVRKFKGADLALHVHVHDKVKTIALTDDEMYHAVNRLGSRNPIIATGDSFVLPQPWASLLILNWEWSKPEPVEGTKANLEEV